MFTDLYNYVKNIIYQEEKSNKRHLSQFLVRNIIIIRTLLYRQTATGMIFNLVRITLIKGKNINKVFF